MANLDGLEHEIETRVKAADERGRREGQQLQERMTDQEHRGELFKQTAETLMVDVLQPRVEMLAKFFDNAKLAGDETPGRRCRIINFSHSPRFPATVNLEFGVAHDEQIRKIVLYCDLDILPIYFKFAPHEEIAIPLELIDEVQAAAWIEQRIVGFVETYLRLAESEQYQQEALVTDPVCGMKIRQSLAASKMEYGGATYYFCAELFRQRFADAPERYIHSEEGRPSQRQSTCEQRPSEASLTGTAVK